MKNMKLMIGYKRSKCQNTKTFLQHHFEYLNTSCSNSCNKDTTTFQSILFLPIISKIDVRIHQSSQETTKANMSMWHKKAIDPMKNHARIHRLEEGM
jgi:hypothetical protein